VSERGRCFAPLLAHLVSVGRGSLLCIAISAIAIAVQHWEEETFGILLGVAIRSVWQPGEFWRAGISFSANTLLEIAVVLLGASISLGAIVASGPVLLSGIVATVAVALAASYATGRALGLPMRISILIACGNAICGNSAIVAVAPVIGADSDDVASSIAFTAILGVAVVLGLPLFIPLLSLSETQYGVLAGLTVYAVPQVLAATAPISSVSTQLGTLVKLVRVLMLGPVVILLSLFRLDFEKSRTGPRPRLFQIVPWFVIGFLLLATVRSLGLVPGQLLTPILTSAKLLTIVSMAALGLGVDVRVVGRVGGRIIAAVVVSLLFLVTLSIALVLLVHVA
jgi:uncharacterized integral membrane protein (TIGR00698 family)